MKCWPIIIIVSYSHVLAIESNDDDDDDDDDDGEIRNGSRLER
jgi:hypothetical protein